MRRRPLPLLLLVADAPGLGLQITHFTQIEADGSSAEGVCLRLAAVLLVGGAEAADEGVEAAPRLAERAGAGGRGVGVAEEGADWVVDLGFSELIEVAEEFEDVGAAAAAEGERRAVVLQVLAEGVPVAPLLVLVAAQSCGGGRCGSGGGSVVVVVVD